MDKVRAAMRGGARRVLLVAPTGAGKTVMAGAMLKGGGAKGIWYFVVHRRELIQQTAKALTAWGVPFGYIAAGMPTNDASVQICSVDTLRSRLDSVPAPAGFIVDECHRAGSASYKRLFEAWPDAWVVGLTGTPTRLDGRALDMFQVMVQAPGVRELMDAGRLADYRLFAPPTDIDMSGVKVTRAGEYDRDQLADAMAGSTIYGSAVAEYQRHAPGSMAAVMCVDIAHAESTAELFKQAGITAACVHGKLPRLVRDAMVEAFRSGHIKVLTSVNLLVEGFDAGELDTLIMLRPTASLVIYLQSIGRALRVKADGRKALIMDLVGNSQKHGLPDDVREWSLDGRKKRTRQVNEETAPVYCPAHFTACRRPDMPCGELTLDGSICGWLPPVQEREIEQVDGDLVEVDLLAQRRERKAQDAQADTLEDLIALGKARGYKVGWARHRWQARQRRQQRAGQ